MSKLRIFPASIEYQSIFDNLMNLYLYDFSEFTGEDVNEQGRFTDEYLPLYWVETSRYPFLFRVDDHYAGFAMIRDVQNPDSGIVTHHMAEFFIMKKYRRQRIGWQAAWQLFEHFPGRWHVAQEETNQPAQTFWRNVIGAYTGGNYQEIREQGWNGPIQIFQSKGS